MELKRIFLYVYACLLAALSAVSAAAQEPVKDQALCYTTWDETYLYIGAKVDCPDVQGSHSAPNADVSGDDAITVYVETGNKRPDKITPQSFSMSVSAGGGCQFLAGAENGKLEPRTVWTFKYGTTVQGTLNNSDDVDMGYSLEIAIPWELMNTSAPKLSDMMSFNIVLRRHGANQNSFVSLAPNVKTEADIQDPSKWLNLLFVTYSFGGVMPGGEKLLCAKSIVRPPLINGLIQEHEWSRNNMVALDLPMEQGFVYEAKYPIQKQVMSFYHYSYQRDPRRAAAYTPLAASDGGIRLQHFPAKNAGPWFSSDRVQWHKDELSDMASSGVDVVLPAYAGDKVSRAMYSAKGLDCMVMAMTELRAEGKSIPLVAMFLDTASIQAAYGGQCPSLKDEETKRAVYGMIKDFYDRVPPDYRAWTQTGKPNAGRRANIVFLDTSECFSDVDAGFLAYAGERFASDFGCSLVWIASDDYKAKVPDCDGFCTPGAGLGWKYDESGRIRIASVGAGYDNSAIAQSGKAAVRSRMGGQTYEQDWAAVLDKAPQWIVCDGWNSLADGSDLCATREYGRKYVDATRAQADKFKNGKEFDVEFLRCDMPSVIPAKQFSMAELQIRNTGSTPWRTAEGYALAYRWYKSGRFLGESKVRRPLERDVAPNETIVVPIGIATVNAQGTAIPDGDCELRFEVVRQSDGKWLSALGAQALIMPITIGAVPEWKATYVDGSLPVMMESGRDYRVRIRARNDGSRTWTKGNVKLSCRLYRTSNYTHDNPGEMAEEVPIKGVRVLLAKDCKPGEIADFVFPLNLAQPDKKPLAEWKPEELWSYQLRFDLYNGTNWLSELGSQTMNRTVDIFEADYGPRFADSSVPAKLIAGQTIDARVVIKNNGIRTWDRKKTAIGYHWYHVDGSEMQWDCGTTQVNANLQPGWPAVVSTKVKAPQYDGQYVLVWDANIDGQWTSTLPLSRGGDILPVFVEVTGGKLAFADLNALCDACATSPDTNRTAGDFDGKGASFPAEYLPPDAPVGENPSRVYPSGYDWTQGNAPDGRISFLYPDKSAGAKNAIACSGQKVTTERGKYVAVHILGASTAGDATGTLSLNYENGAQTADVTMSDWGAGPKHGEKIGCATRHRHTHGGDELGMQSCLYHYVVTLDPARALTSITLPKNLAMKVVAVTFERAALPPPPASPPAADTGAGK